MGPYRSMLNAAGISHGKLQLAVNERSKVTRLQRLKVTHP